MSGYYTEPAEQRLLAEISRLRADVKALQGSTVRIPVRSEDPPADSVINLWMMVDGRLRGRKPNGTIVEYAYSNHNHDNRYALIGAPVPPSTGGGSSTEPPPTPPYVPTTQEIVVAADWSESYWKGGSEIYAGDEGRLYYGMYTTTTGEIKSMIHYPGLSTLLAPGPAGTAIAEVWVRINNLHTTSNAGGVLRLGLHNVDVYPGSFSEFIEVGGVEVGKPSDVWYQLPTWVGESLRDGTSKGITLNQNSTNRAQYGYAAGPSDIRIVFVR